MAANPSTSGERHPYAQANSVIATLRAEMYSWAQASARVRESVLYGADLPLLGYMSDAQAENIGRHIDLERLAATDVSCAIYAACEIAVDVPAYAKLIRDNVRTICLAAGWSGKGWAHTIRRVQTDRWLAGRNDSPKAIRGPKATRKRAIAFRDHDGNCTAGGECLGCHTCPGCGVHPVDCIGIHHGPMPARCAICGGLYDDGHDRAYHIGVSNGALRAFHTLSQIDRNIRLDNLANVDLTRAVPNTTGYVSNY